jgi:hypothetical protein
MNSISMDEFVSYLPSFLVPPTSSKPAQEQKDRYVVPKVDLPYIGPVSLDVLIFVGSAVTFRIYMFWRRRFFKNSTIGGDDKGRDLPAWRQRARASQKIHKAKSYKGRKDPGLEEVMDMCVETKRSLRKVVDPEIARREKMQRIKSSQDGSGYLGMSPENLQSKRQGLKRTGVPIYPKQ